MSKFSHFAINKLYFEWSFNNISRNRGPLSYRKNFDHADIFFWGKRGFIWRGGVWHGVFLSKEFAGSYCDETLSLSSEYTLLELLSFEKREAKK